MKKLFTFLLIVFLSCTIASIYGVLHDQFTYTISPEYYTKFKFPMFRLIYDDSSNIRMLVALTGIIATWWVGLIMGIIFGLTALIHNVWKAMLISSVRSIGLAIAITIFAGLAGLGYGYLTCNDIKSGVSYPYDMVSLDDPAAFYMVGCMHNSGYLGAAIGLIFGIVYIIRHKKFRLTKPAL